jgi:hypothetical protein
MHQVGQEVRKRVFVIRACRRLVRFDSLVGCVDAGVDRIGGVFS